MTDTTWSAERVDLSRGLVHVRHADVCDTINALGLSPFEMLRFLEKALARIAQLKSVIEADAAAHADAVTRAQEAERELREARRENERLRAGLRAAVNGMQHAERYYLSVSAAAEMRAYCNGYEGSPDVWWMLREDQ